MKEKMAAVLGLYPKLTEADQAVERLLAEGFDKEAISVLLVEDQGASELTHGKNAKDGGNEPMVAASVAIGGALGLLAGFAVLPPFIAAGPLLVALSGAGAGGLVGGLINSVGVPEHTARHYDEHVKSGAALIAIHCQTEEQVLRAKYLLTETNAMDVSNTGPTPA